MKNSVLLISLMAIAVATTSYAQEKVAPRSEFTITLSSSTLESKPGESADITISLNRSKGYSKSNAVLGLSSGLPQGVTVTFEPAEGLITSSIAKIAIAEDTKPGNYTIILNGTIQAKSKGTTLKLVVKEKDASDAVSSIH